MASKFGGKQAIGHHWAMQQNMARQKSLLSYAPKRQQPKRKAALAAEAMPPAEAAVEPPKTPAP